ncbi:hypothetical protein MTO96_003706 [Rhipicephalus appendiculatus]
MARRASRVATQQTTTFSRSQCNCSGCGGLRAYSGRLCQLPKTCTVTAANLHVPCLRARKRKHRLQRPQRVSVVAAQLTGLQSALRCRADEHVGFLLVAVSEVAAYSHSPVGVRRDGQRYTYPCGSVSQEAPAITAVFASLVTGAVV